MSEELIIKKGNEICFFENMLFEDLNLIDSINCKNNEEKNIYNQFKNIQKEKLNCIVQFNFINDLFLNNSPFKENSKGLNYFDNCSKFKINFEHHFFSFDKTKKILYFTEKHLVYLDSCNIKIIDLPFTESLKKYIISYFSQSFLEDYQTNIIYPKYQKHLFREDCSNFIITEFIQSFKNRKTKEKIDEEIKNLKNRLNNFENEILTLQKERNNLDE